MEMKDKLSQFKQDVSDDYEITEKQREDANKDIRFIGVTGGMWEDYLEKTHSEDSDRARLEFDMTSERLFKFVGEWTQNRAGVIYEPDDTKTTDDDAELLTGVYRGDFRENGGKPSQDNAIFEAAACGMGAIQISEQFVDDEDPENENQEIIWKTVHNAHDHVMFDANAKEANKSDARWVTVLTGFTPKAFKMKYPGLAEASAFTPSTEYRSSLDWYSVEQVYVAERFEITKIKQDVSVWQNIQLNQIRAYPVDELDKVKGELEAMGWTYVRDRQIKRQIVEKSIFTGQEFIQKPKRIAGKYLPIVPVYAYRVYVGGKEHTWGLVRKLMDGNRTLNTMISKLAETSAASADSINIYLEDQVDRHKDNLKDNTDKAYQVIDPAYAEDGVTLIATGPVGRIDPPMVDQSAMAAIGIITNHLLQKSGGDQDTINPDVSGKALNTLIKRENLNTQVISNHIIESLSQVGKVYRSKAGDIYTRAMMKKAISADGTLRTVELNQVTLDTQNGNAININDLSQGRFSTTVDVGPQYETQQEATVESIERLIDKLPEGDPLQGPAISMWINNIQGTGLEPLKKLNRSNMIKQGLIDAETDDEKQMMQEAQNEKDPNSDLLAAAAQQQIAEANNLNAKAEGQQAVSMKTMAEAGKTMADTEKTKAETAEIVLDINGKMQEGAAETFNRFAQNAQIKPKRFKFNPSTGGLDASNGR